MLSEKRLHPSAELETRNKTAIAPLVPNREHPRVGEIGLSHVISRTMRKSNLLRLLVMVGLLLPIAGFSQQYDLVIEGGRAMDPETGLDGVRNVGISNGKIVRISAEPLEGKRVLSAKGLVVAPGFIDLHQHGQDMASGRVKAFDGVTTALEMEIGVPDVATFLQAKDGHSLINYGTAASHAAARALVFGAPLPAEVPDVHAGVPEILPKSGPATN